MDINQGLNKSYLFEGLSPSELRTIASCCKTQKLAQGETLFQMGQTNNQLFLVLSGQVKVSIKDAQGKEHPLSFLGPGNSFGEMSLLTGNPTSSDVSAILETEILCIEKEAFLKILETHPSVSLKINQLLSERLKETNLLQVIQKQETGFTTLVFKPSADIIEVEKSVLVAQAISSLFQRKTILLFTDLQISEERIEQLLQTSLKKLKQHQSLTLYQANENCTVALLQNKSAFIEETPTLLSEFYSTYDQILAVQYCNVDLHESKFFQQSKKELFEQIDFSLSQAGILRVARKILNKTFGVVLGGGGARGFAHIGVMRALEKENLLPDAYCASSMGSIVASFYAQGMNTQELLEIVLSRAKKKGNKFDFRFPYHSLIKGKKLQDMAKEVYGDLKIDQLPYPLYLICADLISGDEVIYNGFLRIGVYASCALPGIMPPVLDKGQYLVDGSILNKVPTSVLKDKGIQHVLAVNVTPKKDKTYSKKPNILKTISRSFELINYKLSHSEIGPNDVLIQPQLGDFDFFGFSDIEKILDDGEKAAQEALSEFKKKLYS